jgi:glycosyltransferase involved in cell wall biosynthesis
MPLVRLSQVPAAYILHDPPLPWRKDMFTRLVSDNQRFIAISDTQRQMAPNLPYLATIHNGVDLSTFTFSPRHNNHLLFVGRIMSGKGAADAITVAERTNLPLTLFGELTQDDPAYFTQAVQPRLTRTITYKGFVARQQLAHEYSNAKALLVPIHWEEPFGLTMIEAMACGTPVIAFRHGAVPEIVVDGKTGFIVDTVEEMIEAVKRIDTIDRHACRRHVEKNFSNSHMVTQYEEALGRLVAERKTSLLYSRARPIVPTEGDIHGRRF